MKIVKNNLLILTLFLLSLTIPRKSFTQEKSSGKFIVGAGLRGSTFTVTQDGSEVAKMYEEGRPLSPVLAYRALPRPFIDAWGIRVLRWSIELEGSVFVSDRQTVDDDRISDLSGENNHNDGEELDLGTKVNGGVAYLTPVIHLYFELTDNFHAYLGFGGGIGYADISGSYFITDGTAASDACKESFTFDDLQTNCEKREVNFHKTGFATTAFSGIVWGPLGVRFSRGGPIFKDSNFEHKADVEMLSIHLRFSL